ncbi:hypothetical protein CEXT_613261 [Caerostris extrusa]|uniref:Uncharacterized protein n=1 Tax=Caerostris extrusa TaxID=172846 RepID=A0AAV4NHL2_CAEEX|nr:hypothetical protein CEXT_613261 [Caerostris extrusa]
MHYPHVFVDTKILHKPLQTVSNFPMISVWFTVLEAYVDFSIRVSKLFAMKSGKLLEYDSNTVTFTDMDFKIWNLNYPVV